jgi:hypothetical protein
VDSNKMPNRNVTNENNPPLIWEEVEKVNDLQGHGVAICYGSDSNMNNRFPVAFIEGLPWLYSSSYNVVVETLCPRSSEYANKGLDGHAVFKEVQIGVFQYLQGSKPSHGYISEHLWIRING